VTLVLQVHQDLLAMLWQSDTHSHGSEETLRDLLKLTNLKEIPHLSSEMER